MSTQATKGLLIGATCVDGLLAGLNVDRAIVQGPAWRHLGARTWARYSRQADLKNGRILYPAEGIGGAMLSVAAAIAAHRDPSAGGSTRRAAWCAAALATSGLLLTAGAAPKILSLRRIRETDDVAARRVFRGFWRWGSARGVLQTLAFGANLWSIAALSSDLRAKARRGESVSDRLGRDDPRSLLAEEPRPDEDVLDRVYAKYAHSHPFLPITHFVDHATMGPEALVGLGLGRKVEPWISRHPVRPYDPPTTGTFDPSAWKAALGRQDMHGDWLRYFEAELQTKSLRDVLAQWVSRFAQDVGAFLFHGLIRTAHAVRALDHKDTPARRGEVARGLALWAIGIKTPPRDQMPEPTRNLDVEREILNYARAGAATLITDPNVPHVHLVTGPMAYLMISGHLDPSTHNVALASFARTHAEAVRRFDSLKPKALAEATPTFDHDFFDALVGQSDAHPIKLTEAALRAFDRTEDEIFLKAAGKALSLHSRRGLLGIVKAVAARSSDQTW